MDAKLLFRKREILTETAFVEIVVWRLDQPLRCSRHVSKYRLALISAGNCVLRYDNEAGKGDHKHVKDRETAYRFTDLDKLQADFWHDVATWRETE